MLEELRALADGGAWTEESTGGTDADIHEAAAHQKRNWVRLTFDCNDKCIFCLDSDVHDGRMRSPEDIKEQILDGRRKGAERLILSGGEPTIHPRYVDFIKLGRLAGYERVQTVSNARMFAYPEFLHRCLDAGLQEITVSVHGHNARIHDALVGTKGAFEQTLAGLQNALADGRPIVNVDVCVNKGNIKVLPEMMAFFDEIGVREVDLLHVIPFGNAWRDGKEVLFYDLREHREQLRRAFEYSKKPGWHLWLNRYPVPHCEGFEELIQDPYKLNDEIRGRKEEFGHWIQHGEPLDCREPARCKHCYLEDVCDHFEGLLERVHGEQPWSLLRVDTELSVGEPQVYGGDPASAERARDKKRLPLMQQRYPALEAQAKQADVVRVASANAASARRWLERTGLQPAVVDLELADASDLELASFPGLRRVIVQTIGDAAHLLDQPSAVEVVLTLTRQTAPALIEWQRTHPERLARLALVQPSWERLTESRAHDVDLRAFFEVFTAEVPVEDVPACILGRAPRPREPMLDGSKLADDGTPEPFRFIRRYVDDAYRVKSLRCESCVHEADCTGLHVNHVRAHGFAAMQPVDR
jgi:MoaA/NifB/PqqE/SkfB family radical SAM enzyme